MVVAFGEGNCRTGNKGLDIELHCTVSPLFIFLHYAFIFKVFYLLFLRKTSHKWGRGKEGESQAGSTLTVGLEFPKL